MSEDAIAQLRKAIAALPDDAGMVIEDQWGGRYTLRKAHAIGTKTDDPGLVLLITQSLWTA